MKLEPAGLISVIASEHKVLIHQKASKTRVVSTAICFWLLDPLNRRHDVRGYGSWHVKAQLRPGMLKNPYA